MKKRNFWFLQPMYVLIILLTVLTGAFAFLYNTILFYIYIPVGILIIYYTTRKIVFLKKDIKHMWNTVADKFDISNMHSMFDLPIPVLVYNSETDEIIWYNNIFSTACTTTEMYGQKFRTITSKSAEELAVNQGIILNFNDKYFKTYILTGEGNSAHVNMVYFIELTDLQKTYMEYHRSRPVIMRINIDSYEEIVKNAKESERTQILSDTNKILEDFIGESGGIIKRLDRDKYFAIIESDFFEKIKAENFTILDSVKSVASNDRLPVTLSIGIGYISKKFEENEKSSFQALDMALGRGGDQVAIKTEDGFEFFGGTARGIEKRTKVKSRIVASALSESIERSDNVLIMGHKFSDLDSVGAALGMSSACVALDKQVNIVIDRQKTLATPLIDYYAKHENYDIFISPSEAMAYIRRNTLLIIVDTHSPYFVESEEVYRSCKDIVLIDHHRRMVDYIDNTIISLHEPYASSTAEMVCELLQYIKGENFVKHYHAEALLSGIMLDTKNFIMKTGVRTFEAAAYLKRMGADTIEVRRLFANSMNIFKERTKLISAAEIYKNCAIAQSDGEVKDIRIVAPQAADELLNIEHVNASFVMYDIGGVVNVSARSMGRMNVQIIMEQMGGGGHQTMAAAQIKNTNYSDVVEKLRACIDDYHEKNK